MHSSNKQSNLDSLHVAGRQLCVGLYEVSCPDIYPTLSLSNYSKHSTCQWFGVQNIPVLHVPMVSY